MVELIFPFLSYAIVTTITPGPNNITSTSAGIKQGYKKSFPYLMGIALGFMVIMILAGTFSSFIISLNSSIINIMKWIGASYISYLALIPFIKTKSTKKKNSKSGYTFLSGFALQLINPKVILYGVTIYSSFAALISISELTIFVSALFLSFIAFLCISLWNLIGTTLSKYFENKVFYYVFNAALSLLLVYIAIQVVLH